MDGKTGLLWVHNMYSVLPEEVLRNVIEYCIKNPDKYPPNYEKIDLSKPPEPKKEKVIEIDDAVKVYNDLSDPEIKAIKHKDGACLLTDEEASELQEKILEALKDQKHDDIIEYHLSSVLLLMTFRGVTCITRIQRTRL